jgi:hypothetical protein
MSKLVIDVTYLAHWHGKLTGIPRVIHELVSRYATLQEACVFVVWDNEAADFFEVDIQKTITNRGLSLHYLHDQSSTALSRAKHAASISGRGLRKLKNDYKVPVPRPVIDSLVRQRSDSYKKLSMKDGDTFLLTMGEWKNRSYIDKVLNYRQRNVRLIQISYDVLPLVQPQYSGHSTDSLTSYNTAIIPECDLVLAISEHTKKDLTAWLKAANLQVPEIAVFRLGDDFEESTPKKPSNQQFLKTIADNPTYLLCVGTLEARKNHTLLYYVYKLARQRGIDLPRLMIVGRRGWKTDDLYELITKDPETKDKMIILDTISDQELSWLYGNALFTIYPSFYEGWGLPIAESIMRGIPCLSSSTSSMPEIAGDIIDYFSPLSTDECLQGVMNYLKPATLKSVRERLVAYQPHSWDATFKQVNKYIKEIA